MVPKLNKNHISKISNVPSKLTAQRKHAMLKKEKHQIRQFVFIKLSPDSKITLFYTLVLPMDNKKSQRIDETVNHNQAAWRIMEQWRWRIAPYCLCSWNLCLLRSCTGAMLPLSPVIRACDSALFSNAVIFKWLVFALYFNYSVIGLNDLSQGSLPAHGCSFCCK